MPALVGEPHKPIPGGFVDGRHRHAGQHAARGIGHRAAQHRFLSERPNRKGDERAEQKETQGSHGNLHGKFKVKVQRSTLKSKSSFK